MGPHNACSYADLAMTTIDHLILDSNNRPNDTIFPPDWSRFRDDCFKPWRNWLALLGKHYCLCLTH